jgi:hypothetical protein
MNDHQLWLDTINLQQQQGKPLAEALKVADSWPFPAFPNPLDTGYKRPKFNPANHEESPL